MKHKNIFIVSIVLFASIALTSSCGNKTSQQKESMPNDHSEHKTDTLSSIPKEHVQHILEAYFQIKESLVKSDGNAASNAANNLIATISDNTDATLKQIKVDAGHIAGTHDIEHQREHFPNLSEQVYKLVKKENLNETLYWDFCPMANDGKGAYWLSNEKEIKNPYFGDKMLKCGSVKETIGE